MSCQDQSTLFPCFPNRVTTAGDLISTDAETESCNRQIPHNSMGSGTLESGPSSYALYLLFGEFATLKRSDFQDGEEKRGHGGKSGAARYIPAEASCPGRPRGRWNAWHHLRPSSSAGGQLAGKIWELLGCILRT